MQARPSSNLRVISLFEELSDAELARIAESCSTRTYEKNAHILGEQDPTTDVFFILAGTVRANSVSPNGVYGYSATSTFPTSSISAAFEIRRQNEVLTENAILASFEVSFRPDFDDRTDRIPDDTILTVNRNFLPRLGLDFLSFPADGAIQRQGCDSACRCAARILQPPGGGAPTAQDQ